MADFVKLLKADGCSWSCETINVELIIAAAAVPLDEELVWASFFGMFVNWTLKSNS